MSSSSLRSRVFLRYPSIAAPTVSLWQRRPLPLQMWLVDLAVWGVDLLERRPDSVRSLAQSSLLGAVFSGGLLSRQSSLLGAVWASRSVGWQLLLGECSSLLSFQCRRCEVWVGSFALVQSKLPWLL